MKKRNNVIAIIGATATGKSSLAIELAQKFNTEIISADSRLVYKDFDIGTAKPTKQELLKIKHHCIDVVSPTEDFSVTEFKNIAQEAINELFEQNKTPIIAGGTGFYIKALLEGFSIPKVKADEKFRAEMKKIAETKGNEYLYNILKSKDEKIAEKLHFNDTFRVIRALEVIHLTGEKMSNLQKAVPPDFDIYYIFLDAKERSFLYDRINKRVKIMLNMGLVEETKNLINKYDKTVSILKTLGYKEVCEYLENKINYETMVEKICKNTRNFAKRQLTWFRRYETADKYYIDELNEKELTKMAEEKCLNMM